jgi:hypothetical protein
LTQEELERAAQLYEEAAAEFERALGHCRVAAEHFRNGEVPNGTAHAWAARGHLVNAAAAAGRAGGAAHAEGAAPGRLARRYGGVDRLCPEPGVLRG